MKKIPQLNKLEGKVPYVYKWESILYMCMLINALVDVVNELNKRVEMLTDAHQTEKGGVQG